MNCGYSRLINVGYERLVNYAFFVNVFVNVSFK